MGRRVTISVADIARSKVAHLNQHIVGQAEVKKPKKNKYGNSKKVVNDIVFHSIKEAKRYKELLLLQKAGAIGLLELQKRYELNPGGNFKYGYIADFVYLDAKTGATVVEDAKGHRTKEYIRKRRLMLKVHGIKIKET